MKSLLRVLFILALFCGVSSFAHADEVDFHVQVLDPNVCGTNPALCTIADPSASFPVSFEASTCGPAGIPNLPSDPTTYGCLVIVNDTLVNFSSLSMTFANLGNLTFDCPTTDPASIYTNAVCGSSGGVDSFFFSGGPGLAPTKEMVIYENGVNPDLFEGTGSVNTVNTPEPESLLLFSTGAMMMAVAVFMKRRRRFAYDKK
jgi:hypothetical protein